MTRTETPEQAALAAVRDPAPWSGTGERFSGYGVMGLPFDSGHYLALRDFPAPTIGPGYRTVWHRDPDGTWTFFADTEPERSCARYFASSTSTHTVRTAVDIEWAGPYDLRVTIPEVLDWRIGLASTPATAAMSAIGRRLPVAAWRNELFLRAMSRSARPMLRVGRIGLCGTVPNGQRFGVAPRMLWAVNTAAAQLRGTDLGAPGAPERQGRLGDFWLPQRGMFVVGNAEFETFDPDRHRAVVSSDLR